MYIGLYDADLISFQNKIKFNLEIMKLASYYSKGHVVELILDIDDIDKYDKIYIRKDNPKSKLNNSILLKENVYWGGLSFTNNIYLPLNPIEAEYAIPKTSIYSIFLKQQIKAGKIKEFEVDKLLNANHCRLFINGKVINNKINSKQNIFLYDTNISQNDNWRIELENLYNLTSKKVKLINPVILTNYDKETFNFALDNKTYKKDLSIILNKHFSLEEFKNFCRDYGPIIAPIVSFEGRIKLTLGKNYFNNNYTDIFYKEELLRVLELVFYGLSKQLCFGIYIEKGDALNKYEILYNQVKTWVEFRTNRNIDLYRFLQQKRVNPQVRILDEILKEIPFRATRLFNTIPNKIRQGGYWANE